jgi:hypothetical protein
MSREHGRHNKLVCDKLNLLENFSCNDWIVTTAFYSAIHFIEYYCFPFNHKGRIFQNIEEAHRNLNKANKHQTRSFVVNESLQSLFQEYEFLKSNSHNARYINYAVNDAIAKLAIQKLDRIIIHCDKDKK